MKIWIDLANSPHPLLFAPIARRLEEEGGSVVVTARDHAQTVQLGRERWPDLAVIGEESPKGKSSKSGPMMHRIARLRRWAAAQEPDLALSHNSYGQIVAAKTLRLPIVTAMDYEHQPLNHLAFRLANRILIPSALRSEPLHRQGASKHKTQHYDGLKEEIYLADFEPDAGILRRIDLPGSESMLTVVARTSPSRATYHQFENPLLLDALRMLGDRDDVRCVVLLRHSEQRKEIEALELPRVRVFADAVDSRSLMFRADAFIGGGGTMTREAALLGVPTYSVFAGKAAAVDRWLQEQGLLARLSEASDLPPISPRPEPSADQLRRLHNRGAELVETFLEVCTSALRGAKRPGASASGLRAAR